MKRIRLLLGAVVVLWTASTLHAAYQVGFANLTHTSVEDLSGQLRLTIYGEADNGLLPVSGVPLLGANQALFVLENAAGVKSSVTQIYVDTDVLDGIAAAYNTNSADPVRGLRESGGTLLQGLTTFSANEKFAPANLPGSDLSFVADPHLSLAMKKGNPTLGLNEPTERVAVLYDVDPLGFDGLTGLDAVMAAMISGELRIGLHVQAIGVKGKSDSYMNSVHAPEPTALAIWGFGCACVFFYKRWRRRSS